MSIKKRVFIAIGILVLAAVAVGLVFTKRFLGSLPAGGPHDTLGSVPETNPFSANLNPLEGVYKNPFE